MNRDQIIDGLKLAHKNCTLAIPTMDKHGEHTAALCMNEVTGILHQIIQEIEAETGPDLVEK